MRLRGLLRSPWSLNLLTPPVRSISIAEIKPAEVGADPVQPAEPAPAAEPIVAAVPAEPVQVQEQKQDQSPLELLHEPPLNNGNGQSKALVPIEDNSPKKNGVTELPENNNSPSNVSEAEGQQKVR